MLRKYKDWDRRGNHSKDRCTSRLWTLRLHWTSSDFIGIHEFIGFHWTSLYFTRTSTKFTGIYRTSLIFIGLHPEIHSEFIWFYRTSSNFIGLYRISLNFTRNSFDFIGIHRTSPEFIELYRTLSNFIGIYRNSSNFIGFHRNSWIHRTLSDFIGLHRTSSYFIRLHRTSRNSSDFVGLLIDCHRNSNVITSSTSHKNF